MEKHLPRILETRAARSTPQHRDVNSRDLDSVDSVLQSLREGDVNVSAVKRTKRDGASITS